MQPRSKGLAYMVFGVLLISPDSLLVRLAGQHASTYALLFWRQVFMAITQMCGTIWYLGGWDAWRNQAKKGGSYFWASIPAQAIGVLCITLAFTMTTAANALVLFYLQPLWAAMGSVIYFKDPLPTRTRVAVGVGLLAAVMVFLGTAVGGGGGGDDAGKSSSGGSSNTLGDILALVAGVSVASYFMICRACALAMGPDTEMLPGCASGMVLGAFVALILANEQITRIDGAIFWLWVSLNGCIVIGVSLLWMTVAMKYILPPESALIGLLELALGPVWVYFGIGEVPSVWTLVAGVMLLGTLAAHEYLGMKEAEATRRAGLESAVNAIGDGDSDSGNKANGHRHNDSEDEDDDALLLMESDATIIDAAGIVNDNLGDMTRGSHA
eukprot:m.179284 g.179284  ORF g.179284 m.179284 type:complete len:383 (+) comp14726_c0_seq1:268-1416(+)